MIIILSTVLFPTSNYTMQCLSSPSRDEMKYTHAERRWLDIGVPRVRNLPWPRIILWRILAISTIPLHLLWNSAVFSTLPRGIKSSWLRHSPCGQLQCWNQRGMASARRQCRRYHGAAHVRYREHGRRDQTLLFYKLRGHATSGRKDVCVI